ncbi:hypothetical protein SUGI_0069440 [Cryptomeria japonica]|uniref:uncharacterized protein LOC131030783 n=1 Tax=Cryptomeria japonica TaxID=3369 RepID=UPI002408ACC2|nr:uncharacterized protein LOC131030783 [Cryptomeria japonica]GLJ07546.1 hypothetical protein SUGI_0069440 [Cryptomeria japonica]
MEGEEERNTITAALIMSTSIMLSVTVLTSTDFHKTNLMILQAFVILETMAVYSSVGVLIVDLLIEREKQSQTHVSRQIRAAMERNLKEIMYHAEGTVVGAYTGKKTRILDAHLSVPIDAPGQAMVMASIFAAYRIHLIQ